MSLIAKRKTTETWRDAVSARARAHPRCLDAFDEMVRAGRSDAEAAYRALAEAGLLWEIQGPDDPGPRPAATEPAGSPHQVPNV